MKPRTTFANKTNPFTGERPMLHRVVPSTFTVSADPLPEGKGVVDGKYNRLFESLLPGQCMHVPSEQISAVSNALRSWLKTRKLDYMIRTVKAYPGDRTDKRGRVWMLANTIPKLRRAA